MHKNFPGLEVQVQLSKIYLIPCMLLLALTG